MAPKTAAKGTSGDRSAAAACKMSVVPAKPVKKAESVKHNGRRHRPVKQVLEACLRGSVIGQHEAGQDVKGY